VRSVTSLAGPAGGPELLESSIEVIAGFRVSAVQRDATPPDIAFDYAPRRAIVLRGVSFWPAWGVAEREGRLIVETAFSSSRVERLLERAYVKRTPARRLRGLCTTLHQGLPWHNHYHWLIESLPRVYALHNPAVRALGPVTILLAARLSDGERRLLDALLPEGTRIEPVSANARIRPDRFLHLPFLAADSNGYLPPEYTAWLRTHAYALFGASAASEPHRRIFMSRENAPKRHLTNERDVRAALQPLGFETVRPDELTLGEQVKIFSETAFAVGQHGAAFANMTFMRSGKVVEICTRNDPWHLRYLAESIGLRYGNVVDPDTPRHGSFTASVDLVYERVAAMLDSPAAS
jgi:capsular polysaccharide biosynthesis protein